MCHSGVYFKAQAGYDLGRDIKLSTKEWLLRAWKIDNEITAVSYTHLLNTKVEKIFPLSDDTPNFQKHDTTK